MNEEAFFWLYCTGLHKAKEAKADALATGHSHEDKSPCCVSL